MLKKCLSVIGLGKKSEKATDEEKVNIFDNEFRRKMIADFEEAFDEKVAIIQDPENGVEELHKVDGTELDEEQVAFLAGFERGWNESMSTIADIAGWEE